MARPMPRVEPVIRALNPNAVFPGAKAREAMLAPVTAAVAQVKAEFTEKLTAAEARAAALEAKQAEREAREAAATEAAQTATLTQRLKDIYREQGRTPDYMAMLEMEAAAVARTHDPARIGLPAPIKTLLETLSSAEWASPTTFDSNAAHS